MNDHSDQPKNHSHLIPKCVATATQQFIHFQTRQYEWDNFVCLFLIQIDVSNICENGNNKRWWKNVLLLSLASLLQ